MAATIAATTGVSGEQAGLASGLVNTSQQIGGALGLAVLVALVVLDALLAVVLLSSRESREHAAAARRGDLDEPQPSEAAG